MGRQWPKRREPRFRYGVGRRPREVECVAHSPPLQTNARRNLKTARLKASQLDSKEYSMSQIGEPLRIIEVEPLEEPVPEKEVPFEQPADPVKEPA